MKLSIIIPCYNSNTLDELLACLGQQVSKEVEVIIVDDGSTIPVTVPEWAKLIRKDNGGVSSARNTGLDCAKGEYIAFIDADDLVKSDYIERIFEKINEGCDYIYLSWQTIGKGWQAKIILKSIDDSFPPDNLCVWNRVYSRQMIKDTRFNVKKLIAEDAEFIRLVETEGFKKGFIEKPTYLYRSDAPDSLSKRFAAGKLSTKRIVYYYNKVTKDMRFLQEEFKKDDEEAEVILMTNSCDLPELGKYAMIIPPRPIRATEQKGEFCNLVQIIELPIKTQVVLWTDFSNEIGGIETFTYYFAKKMSKYYDIIVLYNTMSDLQVERVSQYAECIRNDSKRIIECDSLIINRILDDIPKNVKAKKTIQMVHGAKIDYASVPQDRDEIICVSDYVKDSWKEKTESARVIHNIIASDKPKTTPLLLVTASRLGAKDKGFARMQQLGRLMDSTGIRYIWLCFSDITNANNLPKGMVMLNPTLDIIPWISKADYLVQLSDTEAFCYSIVEALECGTAVLTTPIEVLKEIGFIEGENGYTIPHDIDRCTDLKKILNVPKFKYKFNNGSIVKKWREVLGDTEPTHSYKPQETKKVLVAARYYDMALKREVKPGEIIITTKHRATKIAGMGYGKMI